jgi:hypothetical protein
MVWSQGFIQLLNKLKVVLRVAQIHLSAWALLGLQAVIVYKILRLIGGHQINQL